MPESRASAWNYALAGLFFVSAASGEVEISSSDDLLDETIAEAESIGLHGDLPASREWVVAPIPSLSPAFGWTVALPVMVLYRPGEASPDSQAWVTGAGGFYAENGSWGAGLFHRMNFREDTWRVSGGIGYADVIYNFYGVGDIGGNPDRYIEINQEFLGASLEGMRRLRENLYCGIGFKGFTAEIKSLRFSFDILDNLIPPWKNIVLDFRTIVPHLLYDSRDNEFYPSKGNTIDFKANLSSEHLGSDFDYQIYKFHWNHYRSITDNQVLALRIACKYAADNAPFFLLPAIGQGPDLRGYIAGLYRDRILLAGQAEYRLRLTDRIGVVAFGGVGGVASSWDDFDEALPSVGTGLRWVLARENQVSLRVDVAWGKKEREVYVGIGEAF
jgi:outer membrane protein assembly factor BamA